MGRMYRSGPLPRVARIPFSLSARRNECCTRRIPGAVGRCHVLRALVRGSDIPHCHRRRARRAHQKCELPRQVHVHLAGTLPFARTRSCSCAVIRPSTALFIFALRDRFCAAKLSPRMMPVLTRACAGTQAQEDVRSTPARESSLKCVRAQSLQDAGEVDALAGRDYVRARSLDCNRERLTSAHCRRGLTRAGAPRTPRSSRSRC